MKFNEKLLELRKQKGWSQEEVGEKINVSRQTISKYESGLSTPEMDKLIDLAKVFEISIDVSRWRKKYYNTRGKKQK